MAKTVSANRGRVRSTGHDKCRGKSTTTKRKRNVQASTTVDPRTSSSQHIPNLNAPT
jgi:hypothetical protein